MSSMSHRIVPFIVEAVQSELDQDLALCGPATVHLLRRNLHFLSRIIHASTDSSKRSLTPGKQHDTRLLDIPHQLLRLADEKLLAYPYKDVPTHWRRLYTDASLLKVAGALLLDERCAHGRLTDGFECSDVREDAGKGKVKVNEEFNLAQKVVPQQSSSFWLSMVHTLDMALIVAGAPGAGRRELVYAAIEAIQRTHLQRSRPSHQPHCTDTTIDAGVGEAEEARAKKRKRTELLAAHRLHGGSPTPPTNSNTGLASKIAPNPVPRLSAPPSLSDYLTKYRYSPFILPGFCSDWPASRSEESPLRSGDDGGRGFAVEGSTALPRWASRSYLLKLAGEGRVVPVEVGGKYTDAEWSQAIVPWAEFLERVGWGNGEVEQGGAEAEVGEPSDGAPSPDSSLSQTSNCKPPLYLAQHSLLTQFPSLERDIHLPDYVYSSPPAPHFYPTYKPPTRVNEWSERGDGYGEAEETTIVNVWMGAKGTESPAHIDPYYNAYAQVVGRKLVWLAPPDVGTAMYAYGSDAEENGKDDCENGQSGASAYMTNTSRVDVFKVLTTDEDERAELLAESKGHDQSNRASHGTSQRFPVFEEKARPASVAAVLEPGDLLVFPPGWWHAMRSLERSFSVSMWY